MKCLNCNRTLPNKEFRLGNKCKWCDGYYHRKGMSKKEYDKIIESLKTKRYLNENKDKS